MLIERKDLKIIKNVLNKRIPDFTVWVFGSRIHGKNLKKFSDLDLVIFDKNKISIDLYLKLKEDFSNSNLPFRVDVSEWSKMDENFKKIVKNDYEIIQG